MNDDVHDEVENRTEGCDPAEIEEHSKDAGGDNSIDQCVLLDPPRHAEMAVRNNVHVCQHGEHAGNREYARQQS